MGSRFGFENRRAESSFISIGPKRQDDGGKLHRVGLLANDGKQLPSDIGFECSIRKSE